MIATDKPRADLVALFDAFARLPEGHASLSLHGSEHEDAFRAWAAERGHVVADRPLHNDIDGRWTVLQLRLSSGWVSVHLDPVKDAAQADPQVLARVHAALDGKQPADWKSKERPLAFKPGTPSDFACTACGETMQSYDQFDEYQHAGCGGLVKRKQPEAAEGSV